MEIEGRNEHKTLEVMEHVYNIFLDDLSRFQKNMNIVKVYFCKKKKGVGKTLDRHQNVIISGYEIMGKMFSFLIFHIFQLFCNEDLCIFIRL